MKKEIMERPEWWLPGLPLPSLTAGTIYTGSGAIGGAGKVTIEKIGFEWEPLEAWFARTKAVDQ